MTDPITQLEQRLANLEAQVKGLRESALEKLRVLVRQNRYRADVVATVPADAPVGYLLVSPGDPFLYVGRGPGAKLARTPLELVP